MAEYLLVRSGKNKYYPTIVFARLNPYSKEDLYNRNLSYLVLDSTTNKLVWVKDVEDRIAFDDDGNIYQPQAYHLIDDHINCRSNWVLSKDIAHGVHYLDFLDEYFKGVSVKNDANYNALLEKTNAIPSSVIEECTKICEEHPYQEWHIIENDNDVQNLFTPTFNLYSSTFKNVSVEENKVTVELVSEMYNRKVELVFEGETHITNNILKNPLAKWMYFWFIIENGRVYFLNNENIDSVAEIKTSTKCISGDKVKYKITPFIK